MELPGLDIDVPGEDVVQDDILDEVVAVVLFVVVLLDAGQRHRKDAAVAGGHLVRALDEYGELRLGLRAERLVGVAVPDEDVLVFAHIQQQELAGLPDARQVAAGDDGGGIVHHADHPVDRIPHLMDDALE